MNTKCSPLFLSHTEQQQPHKHALVHKSRDYAVSIKHIEIHKNTFCALIFFIWRHNDGQAAGICRDDRAESRRSRTVYAGRAMLNAIWTCSHSCTVGWHWMEPCRGTSRTDVNQHLSRHDGIGFLRFKWTHLWVVVFFRCKPPYIILIHENVVCAVGITKHHVMGLYCSSSPYRKIIRVFYSCMLWLNTGEISCEIFESRFNLIEIWFNGCIIIAKQTGRGLRRWTGWDWTIRSTPVRI